MSTTAEAVRLVLNRHRPDSDDPPAAVCVECGEHWFEVETLTETGCAAWRESVRAVEAAQGRADQ